MAEQHFLSQQQQVNTVAYQPSVEAYREFQHDVTSTVLHWMAKGLQMDPQRLGQSAALQELLQPYCRWMGNAPCWMQFAGLLAAKKCQDWSGVDHAALSVPRVEALPATSSSSPDTTTNPEHWMSSDPTATTPAIEAPEYIDVDAIPEMEMEREEQPPSSSAPTSTPTTSSPARDEDHVDHGKTKKKSTKKTADSKISTKEKPKKEKKPKKEVAVVAAAVTETEEPRAKRSKKQRPTPILVEDTLTSAELTVEP